MASKNERAWKPVNLRAGSSGDYTINNYSVSTGWYNKLLDNAGTRFNRLMQYDDADRLSVEISRALDIIAEDISSCNADNEDFFTIDFPDDSDIKKSMIKALESMKSSWSERTEMDKYLFNRVRRTIKYGATFYRKHADGTLTHLPSERMVGYIISDEDEDFVTHYMYNPNGERIDRRGRGFSHRFLGVNHITGIGEASYETIPINELVIMKIGEGPFGESLVEKVYKVWQQMKLLEDSIVIYRVVHAPERRVYYLDTGALQGDKREAAVERARIRLMQKRAEKNGAVEVEYDPHSTTENIFIPTNSAGKGSRVETLPGGQNLGELTDLDYFVKKMTAGLRIPNSMVDPATEQQSQFSDMRIGQMYQVEMRYLGHIKRMKRQLEFPLRDNFFEYVKSRDVVIPDDIIFRINDSMSFAVYKDMELNQTMLNVFNSTLQISSLSKKFAIQKYLGLDHEDIANNELQKLRELGLTDEEIKAIPEHVIENMVYGDGRLG